MTTITINHNTSEVIINDTRHNQHVTVKVNYPTEFKNFLVELFNIVPLHDAYGVKLEEIDEDTCRTVDEW
jgi:hypothetical protein